MDILDKGIRLGVDPAVEGGIQGRDNHLAVVGMVAGLAAVGVGNPAEGSLLAAEAAAGCSPCTDCMGCNLPASVALGSPDLGSSGTAPASCFLQGSLPLAGLRKSEKKKRWGSYSTVPRCRPTAFYVPCIDQPLTSEKKNRFF